MIHLGMKHATLNPVGITLEPTVNMHENSAFASQPSSFSYFVKKQCGMTGIRKEERSLLSLERDCLRNVTKSGLGVSSALEENRPKQSLPHPGSYKGGTMIEMIEVPP